MDKGIMKKEFGDAVAFDEPLAAHTSIGIGGPAAYFLYARTGEEVVAAVAFCKKYSLPYVILAGGTNTVFSDNGYKGVVIHVHGGKAVWENTTCVVDAGMMSDALVQEAAEKGYAGLENLAGLPGTVGGAVRGNAGAYGTEIKDVVMSVDAVPADGMRLRLTRHDCTFAYRDSKMKREQLLVVSIMLRLRQGDASALLARVREIRRQREKKMENIGRRTAGSIFKNLLFADLPNGYKKDKRVIELKKGGKVPAWFFIEEAGCGGKRIGAIALSTAHANTIVNEGGGTAEHVIMLVSFVKQHVRDTCGIQLQEEVQFVGL